MLFTMAQSILSSQQSTFTAWEVGPSLVYPQHLCSSSRLQLLTEGADFHCSTQLKAFDNSLPNAISCTQ